MGSRDQTKDIILSSERTCSLSKFHFAITYIFFKVIVYNDKSKKVIFFSEMYFWIDADGFVSFSVGSTFVLSTPQGHTGLHVVE